MTFYLKYRPQTIAELDLQSVREQLSKILSSKRFPHAFLFSGPKGLGKTSAARIVAKAINCESKIKSPATAELGAGRQKSKVRIEPCGKCEVCRSVTSGSALDLLEIDAASNRGIDDIRSLREKIKLAPSNFAYKLYVIDEAHMLTPEAFNALLKTLEEPPEHAVFILATTEPQKLPATIISRCLQIKFKKANIAEIVRSLKRIVKGENLNVNDEALELIADQAEGSFRDAAKMLEQLSFTGRKITFSQVKNLANQSGEFSLGEWIEFLLSRDVKRSIEILNEAVEEGVDLKWLVTQSLAKLRQVLLGKYGLRANDNWKAILENVETQELVYLIELLNRAGSNLRNALIPQLPLELAIVEWAQKQGIKNQDLRFKNKKFIEKEKRVKEVQQERTSSEVAPPVGGDSSDGGERNSKVKEPAFAKALAGRLASEDSSPTTKIKIKDIVKNWEKVLRFIRPHNNSIEALLRSTRPLKVEEDSLTIEVFYQFHKERLETDKAREVLEKALKDIFGRQFKIKYLLGEKKTKVNPLRNIKSETQGDEDLVKTVEEIFLKI